MSSSLEQLRALLESESGDSLSLLSNIEENPICVITVDEIVPCVYVVWKRYATSAQLRYVLEYILYQLIQRRLSKILCDDTLLTTIHADDQSWIVNDWIPRAISAGWRAGANKNPDTFYGRQSVNNIRKQMPDILTMRSFDELDKARQWLRQFK